MMELVGAAVLADVRELRLGGNAIGPAGMAALADSPDLGCLERLDISKNPLTDQGFGALCTAKSARQLSELVLNDTKLTGASLGQMHMCTWRGPLRSLSLAGNHFDQVLTDAATPVASTSTTVTASSPSRLAVLDLSRAHCRVSCLTYVRDAGLLSGVHTLRLEGFFGPAEARALAAGQLPQFTTLQLFGMADLSEVAEDVLGEAGLEVLLSSQVVARVERLEIPMHGLGDRAATLLADASRLGALRYLNLRGNNISDAGARALMAGAVTRNLMHLELTGNRLLAPVTEALRAHYGERVDLGE